MDHAALLMHLNTVPAVCCLALFSQNTCCLNLSAGSSTSNALYTRVIQLELQLQFAEAAQDGIAAASFPLEWSRSHALFPLEWSQSHALLGAFSGCFTLCRT